jgi:hypothetical protein
MKKNKDYIKGFRHGISWAICYAKTMDIEFSDVDMDEIFKARRVAIKSLKAGR